MVIRRSFTRREVLRAGAIAAALPLLAACGGQAAAPAATPAPTRAPTPAATTAPTVAPTAASTASTAARPAATATEPAVTTISAAPGFTLVDPKSVKISGTFKVVQQKDWNPIHNAFLQEQVKQYAKEQGWPLDISYEAGFTGGGNFFQKMAAAVSSGTGPDFLWGAYDTFQLWYLKTVQPVDDVVNAAVKVFGQYTPGFEPGNKIDGKWYCVPFFNRTGGWWARKSWFADKNLNIDTITDFDSWKNAALEVSDASKRRWGWGNTVNRSGDGETNVSTWWFEAGNRLTDESGTKVLFDTDLSVEAFNWIKDLYTNPKWQPMLPPGVSAWDDMGNNNAWNAGTIGFTSNAGTLFAAGLKTVPDIGHDTYLLQQPAMPIGKKETLVGSGGGAVFYLMQGAKNPDAAKATMQYLLSKDIQTKLFETSQGYVTPAYQWGWDTDPVVKTPNNVDLIFKKNAFNPNAFAWYQPAPNPLLWVSAVSEAVIFTDTAAAILKGTPVKQAVQESQQKIEALVKQYNGK